MTSATQEDKNALYKRLEAQAKGHDCSACGRPLWAAWWQGSWKIRCLCLDSEGRPAEPTWRRQEGYLAKRRRQMATQLTQSGIVKWEPQTMLARLKEAEDAKIFPTDRDFSPAMRSAFAQVAALYHLDPLLGEIMPYQGRIYIPIAGRRRKDDEAGRRASFRFEPISKAELQAYIDTAGFSEGDTPARCIATAQDGRVVDRVARVKKSEGMGRDGKPSPYLPTSAWRFEMACKRAERFCREILWGPIASPLAAHQGLVVEGEVGAEVEAPAALTAPAGDPAAPLYGNARQGAQEARSAPETASPTQGVACAGHQAPMVAARSGRFAHRLPDRSLCYGIVAAESAAEDRDSSMPSPDEGADDPVDDLPASQPDPLEELKQAVYDAGLEWPHFQRDILGMAWSAWLKTGGTVASARAKVPAPGGASP